MAISFLSGSLHNKQTKRFLVIAATAASFASFLTTSEGLTDLLGLPLLSVLISMAAQLILLKSSLDLGGILYNNKIAKQSAKKSADEAKKKGMRCSEKREIQSLKNKEIRRNKKSKLAALLSVVFTMAISTSFSYVQLFYLAHETMSGYNAYKSYVKSECGDILIDKILNLEKAFNTNQGSILSKLAAKQKNAQGWAKTVEDAHNIANAESSSVKWTFDTPSDKFKYVSISFDHALDIVVDIVNNKQYNNNFTLKTTAVKSYYQPDPAENNNKALRYEYNLYEIAAVGDQTTSSSEVPTNFAETTFVSSVHTESCKGYEVCNMIITEMLKQYVQLKEVYLSTVDIYRNATGRVPSSVSTGTSAASKDDDDDAATRNQLAENIETARFFESNAKGGDGSGSQSAASGGASDERDISYNYRASVLSLLSGIEKNYSATIAQYPQIASSANELSASAAIKDSYIISKLLIEETLSILYTLPITDSDGETGESKENEEISKDGAANSSADLKDSIKNFVDLSRKVDDRYSKHVLASDELIYALSPWRAETSNMPRYRMWSLILLSVAVLLDLLTFISGYFLARKALASQKALAKPSEAAGAPRDGEEIEDSLYELFDPGAGNNQGESLKLIKVIMSRELTVNDGVAKIAIRSTPKVSRWQLRVLADLKLVNITSTEVELTAEFLNWIAEFKNSNPWLFVD
ncbi:MAG: hypothetical protein LBU32_14355 [Clostridiales bacterium]|nr:hypothetical protein [Clostridiales bacterium]